ncbi:MAG TPA: hypothetical protein PLV92_18390, partial [Pirellulaceae bacterium]|nr:hypothetical protein [Pirellulaceae bacterium]
MKGAGDSKEAAVTKAPATKATSEGAVAAQPAQSETAAKPKKIQVGRSKPVAATPLAAAITTPSKHDASRSATNDGGGATTSAASGAAPPLSQFKLPELTERLRTTTDFAQAAAELKKRRPATFDGVWGSSSSLLAAALSAELRGPLL